MLSSRTSVVAAAVVATFVVSFAAIHYGWYARELLLDTPLYQRYGDAIVFDGDVPYRDFSVEYPPGALPAFAVPSLVAGEGDFAAYSAAFETLMLLCGAAAAALAAFVLARTGASTARLVLATLLCGLAPLALGPVILSRFDLWPTALTVAALAALVAGRLRLGGAVLGAAIAVKLYPAVLLPLVVAHVWKQYGRRAAVEVAGACCAVVALVFVPFLALAPSGVWDSLTGQASRPLQIESLGASVLLAAHHLFVTSLTMLPSHGSDNLVGSTADAFAALAAVAVPVVLLALYVAAARGRLDARDLLRYSAAAVVVFIALGKVISPQFLVWLIPLVPLVRGRRGVVAAAVFAATLVLTQLWFPFRYIEFVYAFDERASWFVVARNVLLVALLVVLVWPRRWLRVGYAAIAPLFALALAAVGAAFAATEPPPPPPTHEGLLVQTTKPTTCAGAPAAPAATPGTVQYAPYHFEDVAACVDVVVTPEQGTQTYSAAYYTPFDTSNVRKNYAGDAGRCTNSVAFEGGTLAYAVPANGRPFVVLIESCGSSGVPPHVVDVSHADLGRVFVDVRARERDGGVVLEWRTRAPVAVAVYREQDGERVAEGPARPDLFGYFDAGGSAETRYWLRAQRGGRWSWHGPLAAAGS